MRLANRMVRAALRMVSMLLALSLVFSVYLPASASAPNARQGSAKRAGRSRQGRAHLLRSVQVAGVMALAVVQQPPGEDTFVSGAEYVATQFAPASRYGNIGLLAHNYLAGASFSMLAIGQAVRLVYGDGKVENFVVSEVLRFQALQPGSPTTDLRNLEDRKSTRLNSSHRL